MNYGVCHEFPEYISIYRHNEIFSSQRAIPNHSTSFSQNFQALKASTVSPDTLYAVTFLARSTLPMFNKHFSTKSTLSGETLSSFSSSMIRSRKLCHRGETRMEVLFKVHYKLLGMFVSHDITTKLLSHTHKHEEVI